MPVPENNDRKQQFTRGSCSRNRENGITLPSPGSMAAGAVAALQQPYVRSSLNVPCCQEGQWKATINQGQLSRKRGNGVILLSPGSMAVGAVVEPFLRSPLAVPCCQDDSWTESNNGAVQRHHGNGGETVMVGQATAMVRQLQWCSTMTVWHLQW